MTTQQQLPKDHLALRLHAAPKDSPKGTRNSAVVERVPLPGAPSSASPGEDYVLLHLEAASFNRRDEWSMVGAYPGLVYPSTMGCDGVGTIYGDAPSSSSSGSAPQRYILNPSVGWASSPDAPEVAQGETNAYGGTGFGILGGTRSTAGQGTFQEYVWVPRSALVPCPPHLSALQASCLPCAGVTAYRALFSKGRLTKGQNLLVTGIGGGVALVALRLALAVGANVFVTGGSDAKVQRAVQAGARAGADYHKAGWEEDIKEALPKDRRYLDVVLDSAGGGAVGSSVKAGLKDGGKIVIFGMTAGPKVEVTMREVLKNVDVLGSTMGSLEEFKACVDLVAKHRILPDIDTVLDGLHEAPRGFPLLADASKRSGGKVVLKIREGRDAEISEEERVAAGASRL